MDNILDAIDPESTDTLAKEWSLPELPAGTSHPSSSQELAEIFGTSDDEDEEFSFDLNPSLPINNPISKTAFPDLGLPGVVGEAKSSLLTGPDSGFFLNTIQDSLAGMEQLSGPAPGPTPGFNEKISSPVKDPSSEARAGVSESFGDQKVNKVGEESDSLSGGGEGVKGNTTEEQKDTAQNPGDVEEEKEEVQSGSDGVSEPRQLRMSTRLRSRRREESESSPLVEKTATPSDTDTDGDKKATDTSEDEKPTDKPPGKAKEESTSDSGGGKEEEEGGEGDGGGDKSEGVEEEGGEGEEEEAGDNEEDDESDDPDRLWCICHQPHDDRFMICCDTCEEWFHGDCVGITVGQGKRMEREGKEYVCPICLEKAQAVKEQREAGRLARQAKREQLKEKELKKRVESHAPSPLSPVRTPTTPKATPAKEGRTRRRASSSSSHTPLGTEGDQYGLSQLFLPDNAPPRSEVGGEVEGRAKLKEEPATTPCVGPGCSSQATSPSIYCSDACIEKHAAEMLKLLSTRGVSIQTSPSEFVRGSGGITVTEKATGKALVGITAPSEKNLVSWLKAHPSYQVLLPSGKGPTKSPAKKLKPAKKEPESPTRLKIPTLMDPMAVRGNAKKALYQILWKRREGASDLSISQEEVERIAHDVEEKLFNLHQDITPKYKNKYRSLVFNLKDTKNQGLFRKVLLQEISTRELVRMSTEKLASEELAQWRQKTIKKNLLMIKVREEEEAKALAAGGIRKKTYKGDVEIEADPENKIETIAVTVNDDSNNNGTSAATDSENNSQNTTTTTTTTKSQPRSKRTESTSKSSPTLTVGGGILDILTDTTSQHGVHVFDHHCDICIGKKPPPSTESVPAHAEHTSHPSPDSRTTDIELMDTTEARSPDSAHLVSPAHADQEIWSGSINMAGLAKFATTAYPVSGHTEYLDQVLSSTLHVMGRIANVQVWDYVDKLRSSMTRDTVVLRFEWVEEDEDSYTSLLNYLVRKHRCAVIGSRNFYGIKDFYLVPLLENVDPAPQLLPFKGPGIPESHPAMLLGIVIRSKDQLIPPKTKAKLSLMEPTIPTNSTMDTVSASVTLPYSHTKRHHSASEEMAPQTKKSRLQREVGIGDETPPTPVGLDQNQEPQQQQHNIEEISGPSTPEVLPEVDKTLTTSSFVGTTTSGNIIPGLDFHPNPSASEAGKAVASTSTEVGSSQGTSENVQLSFYGQHQETAAPAAVPSADPTPAAQGSIPSASGIQSILLQISDDKLKELASAVSSLNQASPASAAAVSSTLKGITSTTQTLASSTAPGSSSSVSLAPMGQQSPHPEQQHQMPTSSVQPILTLSTQGHAFSPTGPYPTQNPAGFQAAPPHRDTQAPYQSGNYYNQGQPRPHQQPQHQAQQMQPPGPALQQQQQQHYQIPQGQPLQQVSSYGTNQQQLQQHQQYPQPQQAYNYPPDLHPSQPQHMQPQQGSNYGPPPGPFNQDPRTQYSGYGGGGPRVDDPQQNWEPDYGDREHYGDDFGHEHYDNHYDDASKLDRIESHDYGHQSGPPPADWRRHDRFQYEQGRGAREHGGFRDRPRK